MTRRSLIQRSIGPLFVVAVLLFAAAAQAHVELRPKRAPAGERASLTFTVENESDTAGTRKLDMQLPGGITDVSPRSVRGWDTRLRRTGGEVGRVTLTAPSGREIPAGHNRARFSFSMALPDRSPGRLSFKVVQTYQDGTVQRWIGPAGSEEPAPTLRLTASRAAEQGQPDAETPAGAPAGANEPIADDDDGDDGGSGVLIAVLAALAVAAAAGVFLWSRRRRAS